MAKFDKGLVPVWGPMGEDQRARGCVIAVGQVEHWVAEVGEVPQDDEIAFLELSEVTEGALATMEPSLVLSPVFTPMFDCVEVALRLVDMKFTGAYRAMGLRLPKPSIIRREVKVACPDLDFDVIVVEPRRWTQILK